MVMQSRFSREQLLQLRGDLLEQRVPLSRLPVSTFRLHVGGDAFIVLYISSGKREAKISLVLNSQFIWIDKLQPLPEFLCCHVNFPFEHGDRSNPDYPAR